MWYEVQYLSKSSVNVSAITQRIMKQHKWKNVSITRSMSEWMNESTECICNVVIMALHFNLFIFSDIKILAFHGE